MSIVGRNDEGRPIVTAKRRVMVVDDDTALRELLRALFGRSELVEVVAEAPDGERALILADEVRPEVVILDVGLPDVTGRDVLTRLREVDAEVRCVIYTGNQSAWQAAVDDWGADAAVLKGDAGRLVRAVEGVVRDWPDELSLELPFDSTTPRRAREAISDHLATWGATGLVHDAALVVSEIVANAVLHAGTGCRVTARLGRDVLRIEVIDFGPGTPEPQPRSTERVAGRGLQIVSALTSAWGISPTAGGKLVWAELAR